MRDAEEEFGGSLQHFTPKLGFGCLEIVTIKLRRAGGRRRAGQGEGIALTSLDGGVYKEAEMGHFGLFPLGFYS